MAKLVSKTYGEALFEIAMEAGTGDGNKLDILYEEVGEVKTILQDNSDFNKFLMHPGIPKQDKLVAMENVFKGKVSDELTGLLRIVIQKERYGDIQSIFDCFIDLVKEQKGIGVAHITSAVELSESQKKAVVDRLLETTQYSCIEPEFAVDAELIGGMIIRIKDRVVDSSVRSKIYDLKRQLLQIQLG